MQRDTDALRHGSGRLRSQDQKSSVAGRQLALVVMVIGFERGFGATEPPVDITSRVYTTTGDTLDYTYEADDETVTIWGGSKGSSRGLPRDLERGSHRAARGLGMAGRRLCHHHDPSGWLRRDADPRDERRRTLACQT